MTALAPPPTTLPTGPSPTLQPASKPAKPESEVRRDSTDKASLPVEVAETVEPKKETDSSPQNDNAAPDEGNPQRPPIRPGNVRSKFDLELNPFEQSFSRSSHSASSHSDRTTPPRGTDATSIKHNALPPLSSLTSPAAADPSQFPWLAGHSLRSGPLSPAMLPGPTGSNNHHNASGLRTEAGTDGNHDYSESTFRTGFTPGTGSGFTPGYTALMGASGFGALPLPSPNTAAFLNMVTNGTPGEGGDGNNQNYTQDPNQPPSAIPPHLQHGLSHVNQPHDVPQDTITPNTLSALTGVFNDMNNNPHNQHNQPGPQQQGYFPQTMQPRMAQPQPMPQQADYAQQSANAASQAANGLFLLSQAHHELAKREETDVPNTMNGKNMSVATNQQQMANPIPTPITAKSLNNTIQNMPNNKRKSEVGIPPNLIQPTKGGNKKAKKSSLPLTNSMGMNMTPPNSNGKMGMGKRQDESVSPGFSMDDDDDDGEERRGSGPGGKETEEEKRKNFLERNRQAALKCRQRKKAWLNELQTKVEGLTMENERLQQTVQGLHDEVGRLSSILMQHRDCGLPGIGMPQQGVVGGGYGGRAMR